jgi:hypothetical protein
MKPFVKVHCENCGPFMIADPSLISMFYIEVLEKGGPVALYTMTVYCNYCHMGIVEDVPERLVKKLKNRGVKVFSCFTGEIDEEIRTK